MSETPKDHSPMPPRRFTAPSIGGNYEDVGDQHTFEEFPVARMKKLSGPALHETAQPPEDADQTVAPTDESWRWKGQTPPADSGVNRSGRESSFVKRLNRLKGENNSHTTRYITYPTILAGYVI